MYTKYQPVSTSGQTGPVFEFMTEACLWIIQQAHPIAWDAKPLRASASS